MFSRNYLSSAHFCIELRMLWPLSSPAEDEFNHLQWVAFNRALNVNFFNIWNWEIERSRFKVRSHIVHYHPVIIDFAAHECLCQSVKRCRLYGVEQGANSIEQLTKYKMKVFEIRVVVSLSLREEWRYDFSNNLSLLGDIVMLCLLKSLYRLRLLNEWLLLPFRLSPRPRSAFLRPHAIFGKLLSIVVEAHNKSSFKLVPIPRLYRAESSLKCREIAGERRYPRSSTWNWIVEGHLFWT